MKLWDFVENTSIIKGRRLQQLQRTMTTSNREILRMAGVRWLRVAVAMVLASLIPNLLNLLPQLELSETASVLVAGLLVPTLVAADKFFRAKGWY